MPLRTVVLEQRAQKVLDALFSRYPSLEEVYDGAVWRICRRPESGAMQILGKGNQPYFLVRIDAWGEVPSLALLYRFSENEVTILSAQAIDQG